MQPIDLKSFKVKDSLNNELWHNNKLSDQVKSKLIRIAYDFFDSLDLPRTLINDIIFTGSLANYNWSSYSDIDLHILLDFADINDDVKLVKDFFDSKKVDWNQTHNIKIKDNEVEIYVQDQNEPHHSTGVYSVLHDEWVVEPNKEGSDVNEKEVEKKAGFIMQEIDEVARLFSSGDFRSALSYAEKLKVRIRNFRKCGLEQEGELSSENIAFKALRRNGYLERLSALRTGAYDRIMSLNENGIATGVGGLLGGWVADDPSGWFQIRNSVIEDFPGAEVSAAYNEEQRTLELFAIFTPNEMKGRHIGSEILERVTDWADAQQARIVIIPSTKFTESLQIFYKKFGFLHNSGYHKSFSTKGVMYRNPQ